MILSSLRKAFGKRQTQTALLQNPKEEGKTARKTIILNSLVDLAEEGNITILGSTGVQRGDSVIQPLKNGNKMEMLPDGSSITRNEKGEIVKTCDAVKCKREYARDEETAELLVKRFGVWSKPVRATLDDSGTLHFLRDYVEIEERLNGLHIHTNRITGVSIQTHHHNNFELIKLANGEIWKRETRKDKERFVIWYHGKLSFKSETLFAPARMQAETPSGPQSMAYVSRFEQSWSNGLLTREKYTFNNPHAHKKEVALAVQLGTGMLILRQVMQVVTIFEDGVAKETTYELKTPSKLRIDIPNKRCQLSEVVRVRSFAAGANVGLAFDTKDGHEYIVLSGNRNMANRARAGEAADELDLLDEEGMLAADLVLR